MLSHDRLLVEIESLSPVQMNDKPKPEQWSAAECLEHIINVDLWIFQQLSSCRFSTNNIEAMSTGLAVTENGILTIMANRKETMKTPPFLEPKLPYYQKELLLNRFGATNTVLQDYVASTDDHLHIFCADHPIFGVITGYQWLVYLYAHRHRHIEQIRSVREDAGAFA